MNALFFRLDNVTYIPPTSNTPDADGKIDLGMNLFYIAGQNGDGADNKGGSSNGGPPGFSPGQQDTLHPCINVKEESGGEAKLPAGPGDKLTVSRKLDIPVHNGDADRDGIIDFADGMNLSQQPGDRINPTGALQGDEADNASASQSGTSPIGAVGRYFVPMTIALPSDAPRPKNTDEQGNFIEPNADSFISFHYDASNPLDITRTGGGTASDPYLYNLPDGALRIWIRLPGQRKLRPTESGYISDIFDVPPKPENAGLYKHYPALDPASSADQLDPHSITDGGDYIPSDTPFPAFQLLQYGTVGTVYVECVKQSTTVGNPTITVSADGLSATTLVTGYDIHLNVDSQNLSGDGPATATGAPDVDPIAQDQHENDQYLPGKVIVVDDADRNQDGVADFGEGFDHPEVANPVSAGTVSSNRFVPITIAIPSFVDPSKAALRFAYDASDPAKGNYTAVIGASPAEYAYSPAAGSLRIWTKDANQVRSAKSVFEGGDFVAPSGVVADRSANAEPNAKISTSDYLNDSENEYASLAALGFIAGTSTITLYVEAVRANANATITVTLDPDGIDLHQSEHSQRPPGEDPNNPVEPPDFGDEKPIPYLASDTIKLTAIQDYAPNAAETNGIRAADGSITLSQTDLQSNGAVPWSLTRTWTNAEDASVTHPASSGWTMFPKVLETAGVVIAQLPTGPLYFDKINSEYVERFGGHDHLSRSSGKITLTRSDGSSISFNELTGGNLPANQRGLYAGEADAGGNAMTVTDYTADGQVETVTRGTTVFEFTYSESGDTKGEITKVTFTNSKGLVRQVDYAYYTKVDGDKDGSTTPFEGNNRDLKSATVTDSDAKVISRSYYRYEKKASPIQSSKLAMVLDNAATQRVLLDNIALGDAASQVLKRYATYVVGLGSLTIQGAGSSSSTQFDASGTFSVSDGTQNTDHAGLTPAGINVWTTQKTIHRPGLADEKVFLNYAGLEIADQTTASGKEYDNFNRYDVLGRPILVASPSAIDSLDVATGQNAFRIAHLKPNSGLIRSLTYFEDGAGKGYVQQTSLRHGETGADVPQTAYTYIKHPDGDASVVLPASTSAFRNDDGSEKLTTQITYGDGWSHLQPLSVTSTPPQLDASQNGPDSPGGGIVSTTYDSFGQTVDIKDGDGFITHTEFDNDTGAIKKLEVDKTGLDLTTTVTQWDGLGRKLALTDAKGFETTYAYVDTATASGVIVMPQSPGLGSATWVNLASGISDTLTFDTTSNYVESLTRDQLDFAGRAVDSIRYYSLPGTGTRVTLDHANGVTNLRGGSYDSKFNYDDAGRQNETTDPLARRHKTNYDQLGRVSSIQVNGLTVQQNSYDDDAVGDGNVTKVTLIPGNNEANRVTTTSYDWRDRPVAMSDGVRLTYLTLDNRGEIVRQDTYDSVQAQFIGFTNGLPNEDDGDITDEMAIRGRTKTDFDNRGQAFRQETFNVAPVYSSTGMISSASVGTSSLVTEMFHDGRGNVLKSIAPGGLETRNTIDGAGRTTDASIWADGQKISGTATTFDKNGNAVLVVTSASGPAGDRTTYIRNSYDAANRPVASVDFGTTSVSATASLPARVFSDGRNSFLRTDYTYSETGDLDLTTDPRGIVSKQYHDNLGRLTTEVDAYTNGTPSNGTDHRTFYEYNGDDQQTSSNIALPGGGTMSTKFEYDERGRLKVTKYPDQNAGNSGGSGNEESLTYNNLDEVATKTERTGVVHTYTHDIEGHVTHDAAAIPGTSKVDTRVNALDFRYDELGRLYSARTQGTLGNEVRYEYNGFGQLSAEVQQHSGDADTASPRVTYTYGSAASGSRLTSMQYPDGRTLSYSYNTVDGAIGRPSATHDSKVGSTVETYSYLGLSTLTGKTRPEVGLSLRYYGQSGAPGEAGDGYTGLDRFGRIMDQGWSQNGTYIDRNQYEYDADSNLLSKKNLVNSNFSELFQDSGQVADAEGTNPSTTAYDRFNRLQIWSRGTLAASTGRPNATTGPDQRHQYWTYDSEGNWLAFYDGQRLNTTAFDSRNRATTGAQTTGSTTTQVNYDYTPKGELEASTDGQNRKQTYDAWGHVTKSELFDGETSAGTQQYVYDATGRVARETSAFAVNNTETDLYYDQSGHVIVEDDTVIGQSTMPLTADRENVWGSDGSLLFVEDQNTAHPERGAVREYAQQDGQGNTTSVLMPTLGSDFLPTVIDATFDGESVHLTGTATDGYTATLADGSVISATPDASDPTMQSFKQTLEGAISDLGTWQWADGKWTATGNNDPGLTGLKTPFEVKERYVYDPRGLPTVLKSDWSGYDMSGGVPYGNNPKNSFNKSEITFRYLFGQQRWQGQTRLYETMGGGSYDPVLGASEQPRAMVDGFDYSHGMTWAFFHPTASTQRFGNVTQPTWINYTSTTSRVIGLTALSIASAGLATTLWAGGIGAGIGGVDSVLDGGSFGSGAVTGYQFGVGLASIAGRLPTAVALWGGVGINAATSIAGTYDSLSRSNYKQGVLRAAVGLVFGAMQASELGYLPRIGSTVEKVVPTVESAIQTPIDPRIASRPDPAWSIDTRNFTQGKPTPNGGLRNNVEFWRQWIKLRPESISQSNAFRIQEFGLSPKIDPTWIDAYPEHAEHLGETLVHHHVAQGPIAIPVPASTHVGFGPPWH